MPFCFQKGDLVWYTALFRLRRWYLTIPPSDQWIAMVDIDNHRKPLLSTAYSIPCISIKNASLTYSFCDLVCDFGSAVCVQSRKLQFSAPSSKFGKVHGSQFLSPKSYLFTIPIGRWIFIGYCHKTSGDNGDLATISNDSTNLGKWQPWVTGQLLSLSWKWFWKCQS